jgi:hypothetical protein
MMDITRMIDLKHGITTNGQLVKVLSTGEEQEIPTNEPTILFRGRDKFAVAMLEYYTHLCEKDGATEYQLKSMNEMIHRFRTYAETNITKQPGVTRGAAWDGSKS